MTRKTFPIAGFAGSSAGRGQCAGSPRHGIVRWALARLQTGLNRLQDGLKSILRDLLSRRGNDQESPDGLSGRFLRGATAVVCRRPWTCNQLGEQLERSLRGASCSRHQGRGALPAGGRLGRVDKTVPDEGLELFCIADNHGRVALKEGGNNVAEIPRVGTKRHGRPVGRRLDHVLTAPIAEAAADEGDVGRSPPGPQFAHRIDQEHASKRGHAHAARPLLSSSVRRCQAMPDASSIRATAWNRSGWRGTMISRSRGQSPLNCRKTSRAADSSGSCVLPARKTMSSAAKPGQFGQPKRGGVPAIGLGAVVLHGARHVDGSRPGAQCQEPPGIRFILHGDAIDASAAAAPSAGGCGDNPRSSAGSTAR